ncbi:hypothetical protein HA72_1813 [Metallosphaera sedula]|uniref:Uncharacterized protein n=3 Tax=Metallosphaera TaxID=41980 RepID=A4YHR5_METS5|nr:hypothetical protein Msed_1813 [Metallosphaera sedula DSM 5348]AIM27951.1 hypothetical protein HA72_1813 [Metallosphaera sedula]QCO30628.1 hypothetical protein DFR88_09135 [Metallosphaera prunae]AKV74783.1 hypothetical protein MsedA_1855 [Metallosphaera sedula]AKV77019.1 hypothetical protein MsedB_1857 [Metallosphaera sedula]
MNLNGHHNIVTASSKYSNYIDIIIIVITFLVFHGLLLNGYIGYLDTATYPPFVHATFQLSSLLGISSSPPIFTIELNPGLTLLESVLILLFHNFGLNLFLFIYILIWMLGIRQLASVFTRNKILVILSTLAGGLNPATIAVIMDSPITLYVAPLPWFIAFYYRYRIITASRKDLLYSLVPLTILGVYGPPIPSLMGSLLSIEIFSIVKNKGMFNKGIRYVTPPLIVLLFFSLVHINTLYLILSHGSQVSTYVSAVNMFFHGNFPHSFNLVQELELSFDMIRSGPIFYNLLSSWAPPIVSELYILVLIGFIILGLIYLIKSKIYFPVIFSSIILALASYESNYLGIFSLLHETLPIFSGVDPYEYGPMVGLLFPLIIANLSGSKHRIEKNLSHILVLFSIFMIGVASVVAGIDFSIIWHPISVPSSFATAYEKLYAGSNGKEILILPPNTKFPFSMYTYNFSPDFSQAIPYYPPPNFFSVPKGDTIVIANIPATDNPYTLLYIALISGNLSGIIHYSKELDVGKLLVVNPSVFSGYEDVNYGPNASSLNISSLSTAFSSYIFYVPRLEFFNNSNFTVLYSNNQLEVIGINQTSVYSFRILWYGIEIMPLTNTTTVVTPVGAGTSSVIMAPYKQANYGGQLEVMSESPMKSFVISSYYVIFNAISYIVIIVLYLYLIFPVLGHLVKRIRFSLRLK